MRTLSLFLSAAILPVPLAAQIMLGESKAVDGDTIAFGDDMIRINGVDAPEAPQVCERAGEEWACGQTAKEFLGELLARGRLRCRQIEIDDFERQVSTCTVAGRDIGRDLVAAGFAIVTSDANKEYRELESNARAMQIGLWSAEFQTPSDYRAATPENVEPRPKPRRASRRNDTIDAQPIPRTGSSYFRNCDAARRAGAAPMRRGEPGYRPELDADGDGIACEPYRGRR